MRRPFLIAIALCFGSAGAGARPYMCPAGPERMVASSNAIAVARFTKGRSIDVGKLHFERAEYKVRDWLRGGRGKKVLVEVQCSGKRDCPTTPEEGDALLFLTGPTRSPVDGAEVYGRAPDRVPPGEGACGEAWPADLAESVKLVARLARETEPPPAPCRAGPADLVAASSAIVVAVPESHSTATNQNARLHRGTYRVTEWLAGAPAGEAPAGVVVEVGCLDENMDVSWSSFAFCFGDAALALPGIPLGRKKPAAKKVLLLLQEPSESLVDQVPVYTPTPVEEMQGGCDATAWPKKLPAQVKLVKKLLTARPPGSP